MKKQVVRAGKYMSVGILFTACLPVLLPLLFFLSIFGFVVVLHLACALAGFLYLRKYVGMLYRKLPFTLGGCSSWRRRPPLPGGERLDGPLFIDLPPRDQRAIETFESVDPEFDAVVISTVPREGERRSVSFTDLSADDATRREGVDAEKYFEDGITVEDNDHETIVDRGITREATDDDATAQKGARKKGTDDDGCIEKWTRTAGTDDDLSADYRSITERADGPTFVKDGTKTEEAHDDTSPENETRREVGQVEVSVADGTAKAIIGGVIPDDDVNRRAGIEEDISVDETGGGVREIDTFPKDRDQTQEKDSIPVDETRGDVQEVEPFAKDGTATEWKDSTSTEDGTGKDRLDKDGETQEEAEKSFEARKEFGRASGVKEKSEQDDEVHVQLDDGVYLEVDEDEEGSVGVKGPSEKEQKSEPMPAELGEDQHWKSEASAAAAITPDKFDGASENKSATRPDGVGHLLPNQAHEDDIWTCKECEWKYPNAKPSAKIRRNHKKHCKRSSTRSPPTEGGNHAERLSRDNDGVAKSSYPLADSRREEVIEPESNAESDMQVGKFVSDVEADDWSSEPSVRRMDPATNPKVEVAQDEPGPVIEQSSSGVGETETIDRSPSLAEDDVTSPTHEHHSQGVDSDTSGTAISSAQSGEHEKEFGVASEFSSRNSESFRSVPDEFVHHRRSSFHSAESHYDDEQDQLAQVREELQLCDDLNAVKGVVGDKHVSMGPLLTEIEELSLFLGIDLPPRSADLPEMEWAKLAIEVMKIVVGID